MSIYPPNFLLILIVKGVEMIVCQVYGDMMSDKTSDNYPMKVFCDECYSVMNVDNEDNPILTTTDHDSSWDDICEGCGKTKAEEEAENRALGVND